ncbi:Uma2 family endonuclease [Actinosynnema sp. NPDC023587]|uniref:Uma2 family endonuclease n=1 Tax=Actinosynnema sp. NPDC023587 TaxID=3154695 RepID=UPI0033FE989F
MGSLVQWSDHLLTLAEWDALPEVGTHHVELVEGVLCAVPLPAPAHRAAVERLGDRLGAQLPGGVVVVPARQVELDPVHPATVRVPDLVVVAAERAAAGPARLDVADVLVAIEVVAPGTGRLDRIVKPVEYAEAGIPHYWLLELDDPVALTAFTLADGFYDYVAGGTGKIEVRSPFPLALDLPALLTR